jgi:flagellar motor switch protein FliG
MVSGTTAPAPLTGARRAAILMIALGTEASAQVMKHLPEKMVERVSVEMFNTFGVTEDEQSQVLKRASEFVQGKQSERQGGLAFVEDILSRSMGKERAAEFVARLLDEQKERSFAFLANAAPEPIAGLLKGEHPQATALILSHMPPAQAAKILARLEPELQAEVAARIATIERVAPEVVKGVEQNLQKRLANTLLRDEAGSQGGGVDFIVQILNQERSIEKTVLDALTLRDPEMAEQIRNHLFVFEDIIKLEDRATQRVLRDVDQKDLVLAMRGAKVEVRQHILKNLSKRAAETLEEELAVMAPARLSSIEGAQQRIVAVIRRLEEAEEIVVQRGGQGDVLI